MLDWHFVIKNLNIALQENAKIKKFSFLDVYTLTNRGDGFSNRTWHIDSHHLSIKGMLKAWHDHLYIVS